MTEARTTTIPQAGSLGTLMQPAEPARVATPIPRTTALRRLSVVVPAYNEEMNIAGFLGELRSALEGLSECSFEILVVDDGSRDRTPQIAREMGARVISHPINLGNGAAVKRGIREARGDWILLIDGDGQHPPQEIARLWPKAGAFDMVVGSRDGRGGAFHRNLANRVYNRLATYVTSRRIPDLTSGFRLARASALKSFVSLLPNTFSYPTTITLAMLKQGYAVGFESVTVRPRKGHSKINLVKDGTRFFLIIIRICTLVAPLRVFLPVSLAMFLAGLAWYVLTYVTEHRFTNGALLLLTQATVMFALGLISEQIAQLRFDRSERDEQQARGQRDESTLPD